MRELVGLEAEARLVSIVIPAFNYASFLERAIESVLCQDYPNIELIVLDDGSTDNTREVLERYGDAFRWQSHVNMGQAKTLNKGWGMAKGDVLSYLSADDELLPNAVSTSLRFLQDDAVLTYCDFNLFDPSSRLIRKVTAPDFDFRDMFSQLICHPGPGVFMTRQAFEATGQWNSAYRQMPDYDYWLRLGLQGRFVRVPEVLACFRVHEQSQTFAVADEKKALEPLQIISGFIESGKLPPELEPLKAVALSNAWIAVAQLQTRAGRFFLGWQAFQQAFIIYPRNFTRLRTGKIILNSLFNRSLHRLVRWKNSLLR
ncbi:glycosyltransferase [Pseudomonas sp. PD9R]|uniref:glycosyltransferase n=1 Tax=Pseudomonas sp. PD9R TaxID=2853534 RepID=UPI001C481318|nr:glycosyltransferase [Pseudomonas sp. PD9R]MBV6824257.1 glycosyltransferase [Pseudomonas sp. PD9R]